MATIGNRQNLSDAEAANAVFFFNSAGRLDSIRSEAANNTIFHSSNTVTGNLTLTNTKQKNTRDSIVSSNK